MDETLMITPVLRSIIDAATAWAQRKALLRLRAMTSSQRSSVNSKIFNRSMSEPALLTRMSIGPSSATVRLRDALDGPSESKEHNRAERREQSRRRQDRRV